MEYRWALGDQASHRFLHRWDDRSIGQFESRLHRKALGGRGNWLWRAFSRHRRV